MSMLEAECTRCKEIFVPHGTSPEDLIHCYTEDETECGGIGVIQGAWVFSHEPPLDFAPLQLVLAQERHGKEFPNCSDPDCEFHHPELIGRN
jgi:hypothetical protein